MHKSCGTNKCSSFTPEFHIFFQLFDYFRCPHLTTPPTISSLQKLISTQIQIRVREFIEIIRLNCSKFRKSKSYRLRDGRVDERNRALMRDGARRITGCRILDNAIDHSLYFHLSSLPFRL